MSICPVHCGYGCTIFIDNEKNVFGLGGNEYGKLGFGVSHRSFNTPTKIPSLCNIKVVSCGLYFTACCDFEGNVFTFGRNDCGQLGSGNRESYVSPFQVDICPIDKVHTCLYSTICLSYEGTVYSFGKNSFGELGLGKNHNNISDSSICSPQQINDLTNVEFIACGENHVICKTFNNSFYCWGDNSFGKLGIGNTNSQKSPFLCTLYPDDIISIKCSCNHSLFLTSKGYVYSCGFNGQNLSKIVTVTVPKIIDNLPEIIKIECGYYFSVFLDINNNLYSSGWNNFGQLGVGDINDREKPTLIENLPEIIDISRGGNHLFVKTVDNEIYSFGWNNETQLGNKSNTDETKPIRVLKNQEDLWPQAFKSRQKSARK